MKSILLISSLLTVTAMAAEPLDLGTRWELFVDEYLIAQKTRVALKLHEPVKREIVLKTDKPWEGPTSCYFSVIQEGKKVRLYYRGSFGNNDRSVEQVTCVVESEDGIHFTRPKLGLIEAGGTKDNNVVWRGVESHNFSPFLDANPNAKPEQRYKALGGLKEPGKNWMQGTTPGGLYGFVSPDGIHWKKIQDQPVITKGAFDSQNLAFFDTTRNRYACFSRIFSNKVRAIQSMTSTDFLTWTDGVPHQYAKGVPMEHFYTSATVPCPTAPHVFLSFPKRFVPARTKVPAHKVPGVSDAVFMSSRDGVHWDRPFLEAWSRPGPDIDNWTERSNMTACGIYDPGGGEWSLYISEHYRHPDHRIRRMTVRRQGFASMHGDAKGGSFTTKQLKVTGSKLVINYATSAAGSVKIEALDDAGAVVAKSGEIYGDEFEVAALDLSKLTGKNVALRVQLKDADLYALRFAD